MNDLQEEAEGEVLFIADGKDRPAIEARARQVMATANDIRARYTSPLDIGKRSRHIARAMTWAEVLYCLDETKAEVFSASEYEARRSKRGILVRAWDMIVAIPTIPECLRLTLGKEPFAFYGPWGPVTEAPALF